MNAKLRDTFVPREIAHSRVGEPSSGPRRVAIPMGRSLETFGRYQLITPIGAGGMAQVHLARQVGPFGFVKPCVLKRIAPEHLGSPRVREMFLEEARISALLSHPNVVQTFDFGEVAGAPFMALELVDGSNLAQVCRALAERDRWMAPRVATGICLEVLRALDYAHTFVDLDGRPAALVHRDVSPQNILLSRRGEVKLADFGIARREAREDESLGHRPLGKPGYMAPEQAVGQPVDFRADLFAVGVILGELLSGRRLLAQSERMAALLDLPGWIRQRLAASATPIPAALVELTLALTAPDPAGRPGSAREAAARLSAAAESLPPSEPLESALATLAELGPRGGAAGGSAATEPAATPAPAPTGLPAPPDAWAPKAEDSAWPAEFLGGGPPSLRLGDAAREEERRGEALEVVHRSATMDAMRYFGAETSPEAAARGQQAASGSLGPAPGSLGPASGSHRRPYNPGARDSGLVLPPPGLGLTGDAPEEEPEPTPKAKTTDLPAVISPLRPGALHDPRRRWLIPLAVGLGVLLAGFVAATAWRGRSDGPALSSVGRLTVTSQPEGAEIFLDGRPTRRTTPAEIELPVDTAFELEVRLANHLASPRRQTVRIPPERATLETYFRLRPGRTFRVETEPPGALVTVGRRRLEEPTPLTLDTLPHGETATLTVTHPGFLPATLVLRAAAETSSVARVALEAAKEVDIASDPPGADVFVDREHRGKTPLYDLQVPLERRFTLRVVRSGYKPWTRVLRGKQIEEGAPLVAELQHVPLLAMPMSAEQRTEAKRLSRRLQEVSLALRQTQTRLAQAEALHQRLEASGTVRVGDLADAQSRALALRDAVEALENDRVEAETAVETFRAEVLLEAGNR